MLLKDTSEKKSFISYLLSKYLIIKKGELMRKTVTDQWIVAYSEAPTIVDCQEDQIKIVDPVFVPYLLAVENLNSRFNLFINEVNSLSNNVLLSVGDKVDVMMEQQAIPTAALVKYKGSLPGRKGIFFGIEILVSQKHIIIILIPTFYMLTFNDCLSRAKIFKFLISEYATGF